jgi:hypothetical protein
MHEIAMAALVAAANKSGFLQFRNQITNLDR